jgi:hypothetical protein
MTNARSSSTEWCTFTDMNKSKTQFSLRATATLTAAIAVWVAIFREMPPTELAILTGIAVAAGLAGHVVYARWLPWRVTVIATVLLIYNGLLGTQLLLQTGSGEPWFRRLAFLFELLVFPAEMAIRARAPRDILLMIAIVLGTLIFTAAHSIRPSLPSAIITALGIAIWYGAAMMIMASAG